MPKAPTHLLDQRVAKKKAQKLDSGGKVKKERKKVGEGKKDETPQKNLPAPFHLKKTKPPVTKPPPFVFGVPSHKKRRRLAPKKGSSPPQTPPPGDQGVLTKRNQTQGVAPNKNFSNRNGANKPPTCRKKESTRYQKVWGPGDQENKTLLKKKKKKGGT